MTIVVEYDRVGVIKLHHNPHAALTGVPRAVSGAAIKRNLAKTGAYAPLLFQVAEHVPGYIRPRQVEAVHVPGDEGDVVLPEIEGDFGELH